MLYEQEPLIWAKPELPHFKSKSIKLCVGKAEKEVLM